MAEKFSFYQILDVSPYASQQEILKAFERSKLTYSADNPAIYTMFSPDEARDLLKLVEEAFEILGNKSFRALYDEKLTLGADVSQLTAQSIKETALKPQLPETSKQNQEISYKKDEAFELEMKSLTEYDGEILKKMREYRRMTIENMSERTKISAFYIDAVEKMDSKSLPAPVFVRGYVQQIAKLLGLDEKKVCESFMSLYKKSLDNTK